MESTEAKLDALAAQLERDLNSVADRDATLNELMGYLAPSAHATGETSATRAAGGAPRPFPSVKLKRLRSQMP